MAWKIIKQPNDLYCIFSTVVDNVLYYNCNKEEIVDLLVDEERKYIERNIERIMKTNNKKEYQDMLSTIRRVHGKKAVDEVKLEIENEKTGSDTV